MTALSGHQSAAMGTDEWLTPPNILSALGPFDLDPCAPIVRPWDTATRHYTVSDDGLSLPWTGRVWCNPPFGRFAVRWLRRMAEHGDGIALIPARTETRMFYETVWGGAAAGVLFLRGRPHFHYVDGRRAPFNSGAPIALVAYGAANLGSLLNSGLGVVVAPVAVTREAARVRELRDRMEPPASPTLVAPVVRIVCGGQRTRPGTATASEERPCTVCDGAGQIGGGE